MIPKSGIRFFGKDHAQTNDSMIPKSGIRFSEKDHAQTKDGAHPDPIGMGSRAIEQERTEK
ncbi:hypothetical protein [Mesorhizobium sp.]|uniref:hypothetical protein n=1 Tax=Mesorhizobium sp. TaxID=1871066 RepID=UPI000FE48F2E|nr:hypothetical protein [Mesorhizobium sp.]RWP38789.1 MAG: hypothetical protein EOR03_01035 [Mesorhizobium sp.]